jgi:hypothetical protein
MNGEAIGSQPIAFPLRRLPTEAAGPRPGGVAADRTRRPEAQAGAASAPGEDRKAAARRP